MSVLPIEDRNPPLGHDMGPNDADYYRARAIEERWLVRDADSEAEAYIHSELAARYDSLAEELEVHPGNLPVASTHLSTNF